MKKIIIFLILSLFFALPVSAEEDAYRRHYENIGADEIIEALDENVKEYMQNNGIDPRDSDWVNNITPENIFSHILKLLSGGIKAPLSSGGAIIGIILITAALTSFGADGRFEAAVYAAVLAVCAIIADDIWQSVSAAVSAVKGSTTFMASFVPVFAVTVSLSGGAVTSASMSALLLFACEAVSFAASFAVLPLMGGYLALSVSSGVSPLISQSGVTETVKKVSMWILSLASTLFLGILSIQTVVNSAADSVTLRTAKFILGTSVPVAGSVLSEAVSTISSSVGLLRSSLGIYGVVALAVMFLPIIIELVLWRLALMLCGSVSSMFSLTKISGILKAVDSMLSVLIGIILLVGGMFIISLTVVVGAVKI